MATTFTFLSTTTLTAAATTASSNLLTVAASANGSWGVPIGAVLSHANIPVGTTITGYNSSTQAVMSANATITGSALTINVVNPSNINISDVAAILKTGGDVYNISGTIFTIDQDSRFGLNEIDTSVTAASTLGSITISATLGGTVDIDSRYVRLIPFNTGSGTIVKGATITCGSATGKVIGIYTSMGVAPVLTGATGFIKVRAWNEVPFPTSGTFTQGGFTFTISGADKAGFLVIQADEASTVTANRLGLFRMRGTYYDLGTTDGTRTQTFQVPFNGSAVDISSVEVETASGSGVYESFVCANTVTATATTMATDWRGKVFWLSRTSGVLRFGHDGTNLTGGFLPPTGCKVRMYNLITANNTAAARQTIAVPNATLATRYDFTTTGGGVLEFDKVNLAWYPSFSQAYSVITNNTAVCDALTISENGTAWNPTNLVIAPAPTTTVKQALTVSLMPAGINFTDCNFVRRDMSAAGSYAVVGNDLGDVVQTRTKTWCLVAHGNATTGGYSITRAKSWTQNAGCIGQRSYFTQTSNLKIYSPIYYDHPATATPITYGRSAVSLSYVTDFLIDGWSNGGLENCQPYSSLVDLGGGCVRGVIQNFGTYASPLTLGGNDLVHGLAWTRSTTTATVTHTAHGLNTGNSVNVPISSDVAAIVVGQKSITVTGVNTYTFTCLNAGAAAGTLSARATVTGLPVSTAASGACSDISIRQIYFVGGRGSALSLADNSSSKYTIRNVYDLDYFNAGTFPILNSTMHGTSWTGTTTGVAGQYGTNWFDHNIYGQPSVLSSIAYTRTTTVATVTHTDHNLYTGANINVLVRSDAASIPSLGPKAITVLTKDTYTFVVTNAGTASGTISIAVPSSRLQLMFNEPTTLNSSLVSVVGAANFTSAGTCLLPNIGDSVEFTAPEFVKGYSSITQNIPVMGGGTINNYLCTYDIDTGNGFTGTYKNLYNSQLTSATIGLFTLTVVDSSTLFVGDAVYGTSIDGLAKITQINSPTQITMDKAALATYAGGVRGFVSLHNEVINPAVGFKMKWKFTRKVAGVDAITYLYIWMSATASDRQIQYPIPGIQLSITGLVAGSDVTVLQSGTENILLNVEENVGTSCIYDYTTQESVDIAVYKPGYIPAYIRNYSLGSSNSSLPITQTIDSSYLD